MRVVPGGSYGCSEDAGDLARFMQQPGVLLNLGCPSNIRASQQIRRPLRMQFEASRETEHVSLPCALPGSSRSSTWRSVAAGRRPLVPRACRASADRTSSPLTQRGGCARSNPMEASREAVQPECRLKTLDNSGNALKTSKIFHRSSVLHFSLTLYFALSTLHFPWRS